MFTKVKSRVFFIAVYFFVVSTNLDCREGGFLRSWSYDGNDTGWSLNDAQVMTLKVKNQ